VSDDAPERGPCRPRGLAPDGGTWELRAGRDVPDDGVGPGCLGLTDTKEFPHWLQDDALLDGATHLAGIPGALIHGRLDLVSPIDLLWRLARAWPESQLTLINTEGHRGGTAMNHAITHATDAFAANP
jgi:pimeloyl-ACP methyl ester carboxylesterase